MTNEEKLVYAAVLAEYLSRPGSDRRSADHAYYAAAEAVGVLRCVPAGTRYTEEMRRDFLEMSPLPAETFLEFKP